MIRFLLNRAAWTLLVLWVVFTISFFLVAAMPGSPFAGEKVADPEIQKILEARYHFDEPLVVQYLYLLGDYCRGDLGMSTTIRDFTINEIVAQGFPVSALLGATALLLAVVVGVFSGIVASLRRGQLLDNGIMAIATVGIALPEFVVAGMAIIVFVFVVPLFPAAGWGSARQLVLPAVCLAAPYAAYIARLTRSGMLDVLSQDYVRTAHAKGLAPSTVVLRHALKGALLPVVTYLGPATAGILTGSLIEEKIFAIPGIGIHLIQSVTQRDRILAMALTMLYAVLLCVMNLIVDVAYKLLDPRIKLQ